MIQSYNYSYNRKSLSRNLLLFFGTFFLSLFFFITGSFIEQNKVSASTDFPYPGNTVCGHGSSQANHYGQVHVRTYYRNNATGATGAANGSSVRLTIIGDSSQNRTNSTGTNNRTQFCYLDCQYLQNGSYDYGWRVTGSGTPSGLPAGGTWTVRAGTLRNNTTVRVNLTYSFDPPPLPYTARSDMIAGGSSGGGGPNISGTFGSNHRIAQTGSGQSSSTTNSSLSLSGNTSNSNNVTVSAPYSVTDSSGRVWERQGSSRCYGTSGSCRTSGVQNSTLATRTFTPTGIANNTNGTVRVYWFYELRRLYWNYIHNVFSTNVSSSSGTNPTTSHRHRQGSSVTITSQLRNNGDGNGMSATHQMQVSVGGGGWVTQASWTQGPISSGGNGTSRGFTYTIPSNLSNDTRVCFKARVSPYRGMSIPYLNATGHPSGSGTGWRDGPIRCIRAYTPPPAFNLSANCTSIVISGLDMRGRSMSSISVTVGGTPLSGVSTFTGSGATYTYPVSGQTSNVESVVVIIRNDLTGADTSTQATRSVGPCYQATCSATTTSPTNILAGTDFSTTASFRNTGEIAWPTNGRVTSQIEYTSTRTVSPLPSSTGSGGTLTINYSPYTARNTVDQQTVRMRLYLDGGTLLRDCPHNFDPFTEFELRPERESGSLWPNQVIPTEFRFDSRVDREWPLGIAGPAQIGNTPNSPVASRTITRDGTTISTTPDVQGPYPVDFPEISAPVPQPPTPGEEYCATLRLSYTTGWVNRLGVITNEGSDPVETDPFCETIVNQPYVSVFGADVIAAGDFGTADCTGAGVISANFDRTGGNYRGSGAQFAVMAIGQIQRFSSSKMRAPVNETAFANTGTGVGDYGGSYPGSHCITDFASFRPDGLSTEQFANSAPVNGLASGAYNLSGNNLASAANSVEINNGKSFAFYSDSDVLIRNNIIYANNTWANIADIPSFYLIVRGGNIYISNDVTNLDGVYIAQPQGGNGGNIYTCASTSMVPYQPQQLFQDCQNELTVNGALIAETVHFNRYGSSSVQYGSQTEYPLDATNRTCGDGVQRPVCAAEIVNFSPELYLSTPQLPVLSAPGQGGYDSITSLTPIF